MSRKSIRSRGREILLAESPKSGCHRRRVPADFTLRSYALSAVTTSLSLKRPKNWAEIFRIAAYPPGKGDITGAIRNLIVVSDERRRVQLNTEVKEELLREFQPVTAIIATGSTPLILPIKGLEDCVLYHSTGHAGRQSSGGTEGSRGRAAEW